MKSSAHNLSLLDQAIIYQVFVGRWESANLITHKGNVFSRLETLPFENLKKIGINTIYLLGVFDYQGPIIVSQEEEIDLSKKSNRVSSPFSISNHRETHPSLGSISDLKNLISTLHHKDFKVILDFVPNHTSTTHPWITSHPEFYAKSNNQLIKEFSGDVVKLDYNNTELRKQMKDVLLDIESWGVDGVRCDMAHLIPIDFWENTIKIIKRKNPSFVFTAEAYAHSMFDYSVIENHIKAGFDGVYHHAFYENIKKIYIEKQPKKYLDDLIKYAQNREDINKFLINYLGNHDDPLPSSAQHDIQYLFNKLKQSPGTAFIYNGTLNKFPRRIAHHFIDIIEDKYNELFHLPDFIFKDDPNEGGEKLPPTNSALGIDIGGTNIKSALVDREGEVLEEKTQKTNKKDYQSFLSQIIEIIDSYNHSKFSSIGLSVPGSFSSDGEIIFPGSNLPFLIHKNLKNDLNLTHKIPITIENDANCFALAEAKWGIGKNLETVVGITWGTGIGSGIIINGNIHHGTGAAGEFGHISVINKENHKDPCACGIDACLEKCASGASMLKKHHIKVDENENISVKELFSSNNKKDISIVMEAIYYLGIGISDLIKILSPDIVILGGGLSLMSDKWYQELQEVIDDHSIKDINKTKVARHSLSQNAGILGAAAVAFDNI